MIRKLIASSMLFAASATAALAQTTPTVSVNNIEGAAGSTATIVLSLDNTESVNDMQFDITFSDASAEFATDNKGRYIISSTDRTDTHSPSSKQTGTNTYRIVLASLEGIGIDPGTGPIVNIAVVLGDTPGNYTYTISDIEISQKVTIDGVENTTSLYPENASGTITVTEAEKVSYEDYQFYAYTTKVNQGAMAEMMIYFNAVTDVPAYSFDIQLPSGVKVEYLEDDGEYNIDFEEVIKNYVQSYNYNDAAGIITMSGAAKKNKVAVYPESDDLYATIVLDTKALAPGEYIVVFKDQSVTDDDDTEHNPADFEAKIVVEAAQVQEITLQHGVDYTRAENAEGVTVNYVRTFAHTAWQGLYLPFDVKYDEWKELGNVAVLNAVSGTAEEPVLEWKVVDSGTLEANTPCIFQPAQAGEMTLTAEDVTLYAAPAINTSISRSGVGSTFTVTGIYKKKTDMATSHAYGLINGVFRPTNDNSKTLNPYLIFLTIDSASSAPMRISNYIQNPDGTTTRIEDIDFVPAAEGACYDLLGRKAVNPANGIYIVNGNKVLINK